MKRTLVYNRETGELLHSHYEVQVVERGDEADARLSAPSPGALTDEMAAVVSRGLDLDRLGTLITSVAPQSSRRMARWVDTKTERLRARRLEPTVGITGYEESD